MVARREVKLHQISSRVAGCGRGGEAERVGRVEGGKMICIILEVEIGHHFYAIALGSCCFATHVKGNEFKKFYLPLIPTPTQW